MAPPHLHRTFSVAADVDLTGRTLSARFVPYGEVADVYDNLADGKRDRYREGFDPGAFAVQANSAEPGVVRRISFRHLHGRGEGWGYLGSVSALHEQPDGLHGDVLLTPSRVDDVAGLIDQGVDSISIEFHSAPGGSMERDGVRWRQRATLHAVSLEPLGAYAGAKVLAMRDDDGETDEGSTMDVFAGGWVAEAQARQAELERRFATSTTSPALPPHRIPSRPTAGEHDASYMYLQRLR